LLAPVVITPTALRGIEIATKFFTSGYVDEEARITPLGRDALLLQEFMIDNGVKPNS